MRSVYIINHELVFFPRSHILSTLNGEKKLLLSIPASLCFQVLIENQGKIVSHDELLSQVWGKRGINVNNNTLYQNIFLLRKSLNAFELDSKNIISTISKRGFIINENLSMIFQSEFHFPENFNNFDDSNESSTTKLDEELENTENEELKKYVTDVNSEINNIHFNIIEADFTSKKNSDSSEKKSSITNKTFRWIGGYILLLIMTISFSLFVIHYYREVIYQNFFEKYKKVGVVDGCNVFVNDDELNHNFYKEALNISKINCTENPSVYITYNAPINRASIISCMVDPHNKKNKNCKSYYLIK
jgi:DNA-binding winged helix-turn-helix (wHTH) protein